MLGRLADAEADRQRLVRRYSERYSRAAKLEIVCSDEQISRFVRVIEESAHTGARGDGRIFVAPVEAAVNIRTRQQGEQALRKSWNAS